MTTRIVRQKNDRIATLEASLYLKEKYIGHAKARIEALEAALREPNGFANLRAIMADQPYRNSGLSVHEIEVILANKGGFMPDEATVWFREARGKLGIAPEQDK
jgi:hypothetical protein